MAHWMTWLIAGGVLLICEIFSGTFYLLMLAIACASGALIAWLGVGMELQYITAAIVGVGATMALRKSRFGKMVKTDAARDPNVNLDIGQLLNVPEWKGAPDNRFQARVMYRGAMWDVELDEQGYANPGVFKVKEIRGSRLILINSELHVK